MDFEVIGRAEIAFDPSAAILGRGIDKSLALDCFGGNRRGVVIAKFKALKKVRLERECVQRYWLHDGGFLLSTVSRKCR